LISTFREFDFPQKCKFFILGVKLNACYAHECKVSTIYYKHLFIKQAWEVTKRDPQQRKVSMCGEPFTHKVINPCTN
jgi:hypothetical protein